MSSCATRILIRTRIHMRTMGNKPPVAVEPDRIYASITTPPTVQALTFSHTRPHNQPYPRPSPIGTKARAILVLSLSERHYSSISLEANGNYQYSIMRPVIVLSFPSTVGPR